ncbi:MAG: PTS sugar transporter subunit IIC [candidate division WOR-3 bacterium]|nr:PTS sugar transporter subunit IIC [candidate division WOR-3 bacterium]
MMVILLTLIGALILLDKYAVGEFGLSQPIVSGAIIGALCGDVQVGIFVGALFQLVFLANLPIGKDVPPDAQAAGIAGCGSYFLLKSINQNEPNLMIVFLVGILVSVIGNYLDIIVRRINEGPFYRFLRDNKKLYICHFSGIVMAFLRGVFLFLPIFLLVSIIRFPFSAAAFNKDFLLIVIFALGIANGIYLYLKRQSFYFLVIGAICALVYFVF